MPCEFSAAGHCNPDHGDRLLLLRSGDVETNPGPGPGGCCAFCGLSMETYHGPLRCAAGCGAVSHRRMACSGLRREDQNRGIWWCAGCTLPSGEEVTDASLVASSATQGRENGTGLSLSDGSDISSTGREQVAVPAISTERERAGLLDISTMRELSGFSSSDGTVVSSVRENVSTSTISTAREEVEVSVSSTEREQVGELTFSTFGENVFTPAFSTNSREETDTSVFSTDWEQTGVKQPVSSPDQEQTGVKQSVFSTEREQTVVKQTVPSIDWVQTGVKQTPSSTDSERGVVSGPSIRRDSGRAAERIVQPPSGGDVSVSMLPEGRDPPTGYGGTPPRRGGRGQARQSPSGGEAAPVNSSPVQAGLGGRGQARQSPSGGVAAPVNSPRVQARRRQNDPADRPVGGRKCPACNTRLGFSRNPLICCGCQLEHHKKCSGLARHALASWQANQQWECSACTARGRQVPTNPPDVESGPSRSQDVSLRDSLKVVQWNVDGLTTSLVDLRNLVEENKDIDALLIQETKLHPSARDPSLPGYVVVRRDRPSGGPVGGGLMTFVKKDIPHRVVNAYSGDEEYGTEVLAVEIQLSRGRCFPLVNVYRPPNRGGGQGHPSFDHIRVPVTPFLMAGDFNAHSPLWDDSQPSDRWGEALEGWIMDHPMAALNSGDDTRLNRATGGLSAPDVSLVHNSLLAGAEWKVLPLLGSDHHPILITLEASPVVVKECESKLRWDWRNANWEEYGSAVDLAVAEAQSGMGQASMEEKIKILQESMDNAAKTHIGMVRVKSEGRNWMTPELRAAIRRRNWLARRIATHREAWLEACREVREKTSSAKSESWRSFVNSLESQAGSSRVWGVIRSLNGKPSATNARNAMLEHRGRAIYDPTKKADAFCQHYAAVSRHSFSAVERKVNREMRIEMSRAGREAGPVGQESAEFSLGELKAVLRLTKSKGAAGPDEIHPLFLKNLKDGALNFVLGIFNDSWVKGYCPQSWRNAVIVPILKPGKPAGEIASHRPIALTSCLGKLMERLVANRLKHIAESAGLWCENQAGFRAQRGTEDQILRLSQSVFDGFQCKKAERTVLALLDFSKAYDTVWQADLLASMARKGVPPRFVRWIKAFLTNRQAKVRLGGVCSKNRLFREGVPQGCVLSPLLFLFVIDTLNDRLPRGLHVSMYADDVALWARSPEKEVAASLVEEGVRAVWQWSKEKKLTLSIEKCEVSFFTSDTSEFEWRPSVVVDGRALPFNPTPRFLGVKYDRMFSFAEQVKAASSTLARGCRMLTALSGSDWGWKSDLLKKVFSAASQSGSDYCAAGWQPWLSVAGVKKLTQARNRCLRVITGQFSSSPEESLRLEVGIPSMETAVRRSAATAYEKSLRLPADNPRAAVTESGVPHKWKRHLGWRMVARKVEAELEFGAFPRLPLPPPTVAPWEGGDDSWGIALELRGGSRRTDPPDRVLDDALDTIRAYGRPDSVFYTDGSVDGGTQHGGSAVVETTGDPGQPHFRENWREIGPRYASSFETEAYALLRCVSLLADGRQGRFLICSDSRSALSALKGGELKDHPILWQVRTVLRSLSCEVLFQWVPGHCGLPGNEEADRVAREAALDGREGRAAQDVPVTFGAAKSAIKRAVKDPDPQHERVRQVYRGPLKRLQGISRKEEVLLARLRSGHCLQLAAYRDWVQEIGSTCQRCNNAPETVAHLMANCEATEALRVLIFWEASPTIFVLSGEPRKLPRIVP